MSSAALSAPVEAWQVPEELERLLDFYRDVCPARTLEVGSFAGGVLWHFLQVSRPGAVLVSLDLTAPNKHLYPDWVPDGVTLEVVEGDSRSPEAQELVQALGPYDFVFIDAAHDYESVKSDWLTYGAMCKGPVAFHDIHHVEGEPDTWDNCQVHRLWREIQASGRTTREIIHDYAQRCFGIGIVL